MERLNVIFLSSILDRVIKDESDETVGILKDVYVQRGSGYPRVIGYKVDKDGDIYNHEFREIEFYEDNKGKVFIEVKGVKDIIPQSFSFRIRKDLLDRTVYDSTGKESFRVYDVRLAQFDDGLHVIAVSKSRNGIARRRGVLYNLFDGLRRKKGQDALILWDDVRSLHETGSKELKIDVPYKELSTLHPADLAEVLESVESSYRSKVFESLDEELAADTLEEIEEPSVQAEIISGLSEEKAQEILEMIPNDEIAGILDELDEETREKIMSNLEIEDADEVKELLSYEDEDAGALMAKDFLSFTENMTVDEAREVIMDLNDEYDTEDMYYIFITDSQGVLKGYISLSDLLKNAGDRTLQEIMNPRVEDIHVNEHAATAVDLAIKYELLMIPVTDDENKLLGVINIHDVMDEFLAPLWKKN